MAAHSSKPMLVTSERLYSFLLYVYPKRFRQIYGREMVLTFRDCCREALQQSGGWGLVRWWSFILSDLLMTAFLEHLKAVIALCKRLLGLEREYTMIDNLLRLDIALQTDVGRKRPHNEDSMVSVVPDDPRILEKKGALFVVADGMGGHAKGEVASDMAVNIVNTSYYEDDDEDIASSLARAVKQANSMIYDLSMQEQSGMGTTCIACVLLGDTVFIANVGDSRAYLVREGLLRQVTQDHSWVAEQVRVGILTREQARKHERRNIIYRSLGCCADVEVDIFTEQVQDGDVLVLCTDGLSEVVEEDELCSIVEQYASQESVTRLIERANECGGPDNITAIVARVALPRSAA
jgi:serine/threonine protein phosphatase PrpC